MQAIVQDRYGEAADVLRLEETGRPAIGDGEVLLRVHAAGVDRGVWHLMTGLPYPVRLAGYGVRAPKTRVRGREVAGRVEAIGKDVTTFQVGDEVFGIAEGAFAEYACAQPGKLARRPENLTAVAGGGRARLSPDRPAGCPRPRARASRAEGPGHRRIGRRRDVRRADRQGLRRRSHRRVQHREGGPGPVDRRGPRDRLHARRHRRRSTPLRRDHRHRREPPAPAASRAPLPAAGPWSSSGARPAAGGSEDSTAACGHPCSRGSSRSGWPRS